MVSVVNEMTNHRRGKGQGSYYLSRVQLIILAVGFTATSLVVFFLGVFIGQGIEERKLMEKEEPVVKIPVEPLLKGSGQAPAAKEEITFYDTLSKGAEGGGPARGGVKQKVKPIEESTRQAAVEAKAPAREKAVAQVAEKAVQKPANGVWTVQLNAFPQERDADRLAKRLKDKGYDAYVASTDIKGKTWYRVRVGHFATREEARALQEELRVKEKFTKSMTVSR